MPGTKDRTVSGRRKARAWCLLYRAPDLPKQWIAHCLDLDVMSQGNDPRHALGMLVEPIDAVVVNDVEHGRDPLARKTPSKAAWDHLYRVKRQAEQMATIGEFEKIGQVDIDELEAVATQLLIILRTNAKPLIKPVPAVLSLTSLTA